MTEAALLGPIGDLPAHAHHYARLGWAIFPVNPTDKTPLVSQYQATTDPDTITTWWGRWPTALIGHRLPPDVIVLDIDPRHGGLDTWAALKHEIGQLPITRGHVSGRGDRGGHTWWLRPDDQLTIRPLTDWARDHQVGHELAGGRWTSGIDLLHHEHRYTILPPSPHPDTGRPYQWIDGRGPETPPAPLPQLLVDLLTTTQPAEPPPPPRPPDPDSIADWYSATHTWTELLTRHGWRLVGGDGNTDRSRWRHPTATSAFSATIRHGCLFVYCVPEETEALTRQGWKRWWEIDPHVDELLTLDPDTGAITWQHPTAINVFADEERQMVRLHHRQFEAITTPDHRWLMRGSGRSGGRTDDHVPWHWETSAGLAESPRGRRIIASGGTYSGPSVATHSDELVALIAWVVCEGHYPKVGRGVRLFQSEKHNPEHVATIRSILATFAAQGATVSEYPRDTPHGRIIDWYLGTGIGPLVRQLAPDKQLTPEFLSSLTASQLELLVETLIDGDGHRGNSDKWAQKDQRRIDSFQQALAMLGRRSGVTPHTSGETSIVTAYKVTDVYSENLRADQISYRGKVWCPTTPTGTWMARHNGSTFWTGNSPNTPFEVTEPGRPAGYTLFRAWATLEHGGDLTAAARAARVMKDGPAAGPDPLTQLARSTSSTSSASPAAPTESLWLPDLIWDARPTLTHIRDAARARLVAPDAVLAATLCRIAAATPHIVDIPAIIGAPMGLTTYAALVGPPEAGKSAAAAVAAELVPVDRNKVRDRVPIGSGEGFVEILYGMRPDPDDPRKKIRTQTHWAAIFHIDEGAVLTDLGARSGSTLLPTLRTAYTHGTLGNANATLDRRRIIEGHSYVYGVTLGIQPELAAPLLADHTAGTPQRFLWAMATDPTAPDTAGNWPGSLDWAPPTSQQLAAHEAPARGGMRRATLTYDQAIIDEVHADRRAVLRQETTKASHDAHGTLLRLKVAALLGILDGDLVVTREHWELARIICDTSRAVRVSIEHTISIAERQKTHAARERRAQDEVYVETAKQQRQLTGAARSAARGVYECDTHDPAEGCPRRCLQARLSSRSKRELEFDDIADTAIAKGWLTRHGDRFRPGESRPA